MATGRHSDTAMKKESLPGHSYSILWIPVSLIALQSLAVLITHFFILPSLQRQHNHAEAVDLSRRAISALWYGNSDLNLLCSDWADWDEMADAVHNWTKEFEQKNLPDGTCDDYNMDIILVLDKNGNMLFTQTARDSFQVDFTPAMQSTSMDCLFHILKSQGYRMDGFYLLDRMPFYVQSHPIAHEAKTEEAPEPEGYLVMARHLSGSFTSRLSTLLQLPVEISAFSLKDHMAPPWFPISDISLNTGLVRFRANGHRLEVISFVSSATSGTGLLLRLTAEQNHSFASQNILWSLVAFLLLTNLLMALYLTKSRKSFNKRLHFLLNIVGKISGRLSIPADQTRTMDDLDSLHEVLNNLYWNIQKIEKEKEVLRSRELIREKLVSAGRIAAELSHEILTPIRVVRNCLTPIERKLGSSSLTDRDREMFTMIHRELDGIETLTRNLLRFFREDEIDGTPTELLPVIHSAIERFAAVAGDNGPDIRSELKANGQVFVSAHQLEQVILNLLRNAMEASCTTIHIQTDIDDLAIRIRISDNGEGISEDIRNRIFEPFFTRKKKRGVGLGLNISYNIIRNYDGELFLEESEAMATCFVIQLPLMEEIHGNG